MARFHVRFSLSPYPRVSPCIIRVMRRWILVFERGSGLNGLTKNSGVMEFLSGVGETT